MLHPFQELALEKNSIHHQRSLPFCRVLNPLPIIVVPICVIIDSRSVLATFWPSSNITIPIYIFHFTFAIKNSILKLAYINISSFILILALSFHHVITPFSLVNSPTFVSHYSYSIFCSCLPTSFVSSVFIKLQTVFSAFRPFLPRSSVYWFINFQ